MRTKIYSILLLALYAGITVATSKTPATDYPTLHYAVASNCSNATMTSGQIAVSQATITSPPNTDFRALGFANQFVSIGNSDSGELAPALTRTCSHSLDTSVINTTVSVYTCVDNGITSCTINLTHLD